MASKKNIKLRRKKKKSLKKRKAPTSTLSLKVTIQILMEKK
jgi:hypothetical protein